MARSRTLQPIDVVTGLVSGVLAAAFFTLATVAAVSGDGAEPVVVDSAESTARR